MEEAAPGGDLRTRDLLGSCWHWSEGEGFELETLPLLDGADFNADLFSQKSKGEDGKIVRFGKRKGGGLVQDLNFPQPGDPPGPVGGPAALQSVCTLDKVKSALRRAEGERAKRKASDPCCSTGGDSDGATPLLATGCPRCLLYVLLPRFEPKCPRCGFLVQADDAGAEPNKRPRLLGAEPNKRPRLLGSDAGGRAVPAPNAGAAGPRTPDVGSLLDLNTVSF